MERPYETDPQRRSSPRPHGIYKVQLTAQREMCRVSCRVAYFRAHEQFVEVDVDLSCFSKRDLASPRQPSSGGRLYSYSVLTSVANVRI